MPPVRFGVSGSVPSPIARDPYEDSYKAALETGAGDYDRLMQYYESLLSQPQEAVPQFNYTPITPQLRQYIPTQGFTDALESNRTLSSTGGYRESDLANIRTRGISPIRSIYANAKRNLDRQRTLSGGYSPNYAAVTAKMARESSDIIGEKSAAIEADIADRVARGRLSSIGGYNSLASEENRLRNEAAASNVSTQNEFAKVNATLPMQMAETNSNLLGAAQGRRMQPIQGAQSLYGTTPANTALLGNFSLDRARLGQQESQFTRNLDEERRREKNRLGASILGTFAGFR